MAIPSISAIIPDYKKARVLYGKSIDMKYDEAIFANSNPMFAQKDYTLPYFNFDGSVVGTINVRLTRIGQHVTCTVKNPPQLTLTATTQAFVMDIKNVDPIYQPVGQTIGAIRLVNAGVVETGTSLVSWTPVVGPGAGTTNVSTVVFYRGLGTTYNSGTAFSVGVSGILPGFIMSLSWLGTE